jgi:hypothetical protein
MKLSPRDNVPHPLLLSKSILELEIEIHVCELPVQCFTLMTLSSHPRGLSCGSCDHPSQTYIYKLHDVSLGVQMANCKPSYLHLLLYEIERALVSHQRPEVW